MTTGAVWSSEPKKSDPHDDPFPSGGFIPGRDPDTGDDTEVEEVGENLILDPSHFVTPAQTTFIETDIFDKTRLKLELDVDGGGPVTIFLSGPTTVEVDFDGPLEGSAIDHNGDGLDEVRIRPTFMELTGHSQFGPVTLRLNPNGRNRASSSEHVR